MVEFKFFLKGFVTKLFINILHYSNIFYFLFQFKYFHDLKNNFVASNFPLIEVIFSINTLTLHLDFKNFYKQASMPILDRDLIERIWEQVLQRSDEEISDLIRRPSGVLFDAAMSGNVEFLALLLCKYPDLLWEVNEKEQSVFHVAVMHRHVHVFNLIYNIGAAKDYMVGNVDVDKNNMLHLAGMLPLAERLGAPRANLQMQRELLWFKVFLITRSLFLLVLSLFQFTMACRF